MTKPALPNEPGLVWPPRIDAAFEPVVFDTKTNTMMSVAEATESLGLIGSPPSAQTFQAKDPDDPLALFAPERATRRAGRDIAPAFLLELPSPVSWRSPRALAIGILALILFLPMNAFDVITRRSGAAAPATSAGDVAGTSGTLSTRGDIVLLGDIPLPAANTSPNASPGIRRPPGRSAPGTPTAKSGTSTPPAPAAASGFVVVTLPFAADIYESDQRLGTTSNGRLALAPGQHSLRLTNDSLNFDSVVNASVAKGTTTALKPAVPEGTLRINAMPWANVWIDNRPVGETPLGNIRVRIGTHEVRFAHPQLGERRMRILVPAGEATRVSVDLR